MFSWKNFLTLVLKYVFSGYKILGAPPPPPPLPGTNTHCFSTLTMLVLCFLLCAVSEEKCSNSHLWSYTFDIPFVYLGVVLFSLLLVVINLIICSGMKFVCVFKEYLGNSVYSFHFPFFFHLLSDIISSNIFSFITPLFLLGF